MVSGRMALFLVAAALWATTTGCSLARPHPATPARELPAPHASTPTPSTPIPPTEPDVPEGVFHRIAPGQTVWRIARAYGVEVEALLSANALSDPTTVASGSMLFVPGAKLTLDVPPFPALPPAPPVGDPPEVLALPIPDGFVWPVAGGAVLSRFGAPRKGRRHAGIDIRGPRGQEILATEAGEVVYCGAKFSGYGKMVMIDHGEGLESVYAHASDLLVEVGDHVERGQAVARVGRTGNATTEHCHFELRENKVPIDPLPRYPELARELAGTEAEFVVRKHDAKASRRPTSGSTKPGGAVGATH